MSAFAVVAIASLSFSSADGAGAFAQEVEADTAIASNVQDETLAAIEIVPQQPVFVSEEVVQPLPEPTEQSTSNFEASSLRELVGLVDQSDDMSEQMRCLAGAVYFEARGEPLDGQLAVANVVINRADDRRFPASYCGVVYQRAQFSFVKNGRMPRIKTSSAAWDRAKSIARIAHDGMWESQVGEAVYFHAKYVRPKWSYRKTRTATIDTHIFYR
ncbi:cell wall hydrolase [uncultured Erythrobacter sp.]|uniref:cell wall hydrolase n=1 Tax=uncultured Erythrobacter sp. TaxID=263913 RepID=UPI0026194C33|nr:cell wall hydrolase [uncultured Erythrobacter sp.]